MSATKHCVLWGGYGWGNTGDELLLAVAIQDARARFGSEITVLSRRPHYTRWMFPDVQVVPYEPRPASQSLLVRAHSMGRAALARVNASTIHPLPRWRLEDQTPADGGTPAWLRAIKNARQLYVVGGGYLTDLFAADYLFPLEVAKQSGIPIATAPLGLGPFRARDASRAVANALRGADVLVRDQASLDWCQEQDVAARWRADDGFRVREVVPDLRRSATPAGARPRIGVSLYRQHGGIEKERFDAWWVSYLTELAKHRSRVDVEGFCFHYAPEEDFYSTVALFDRAGIGARAVRAPVLDYAHAIRELDRYDAVVSTRFHAIVCARVLGVPHLAIASGAYYREKMQAALKEGTIEGRIIDPATEAPEAAAREAIALAEADAGRRRSP